MTKAQLEAQVMQIIQGSGISVPRSALMQHQFSKLCNLLADYFADTSCNPPIQVFEIIPVGGPLPTVGEDWGMCDDIMPRESPSLTVTVQEITQIDWQPAGVSYGPSGALRVTMLVTSSKSVTAELKQMNRVVPLVSREG